MKQGNNLVNREIVRMNEESAGLEQAHLNTKNVIQNLCNDNEKDCNLIASFHKTNV